MSFTPSHELAHQAFQKGDLSTAEQHCRRLIARRSTDTAALNLLGVICLETARSKDAVQLLRRAVALQPGEVRYRINLAMALEQTGQLEAALAANLAIVADRPEYAGPHFNLGNIYRLMHRYGEAEDSYREAVRLAPTDFQPAANLAGVLSLKGDAEGAIAHYRAAIALAPDVAELYSNLGNALLESGESRAAAEAYEQALKLNPDHIDSLCNLAAAEIRGEDTAKALDTANSILRLDPGNRTAAALLCIVYAATGRTADLERLLDFDRLIGDLTLAAPDGYATLEAFNADLRQFVVNHQTLEFEPGTKTTRMGYQTRNLLLGDAGPVAKLKAEIDKAVRDYFDAIDLPADHPFSVAPGEWDLNIWATVLDQGGHQMPHIHPAGLLSGVYYVQIPPNIGGDNEHRGWIEFGRPPEIYEPFAQLITRDYEPRAGRLFLFPSYFYHRTIPFESGQRRISIAFDVVPRSAPESLSGQEASAKQKVGMAKRYLRNKHYQAAKKLCHAALDVVPDYPEALHTLGLVGVESGDLESGLRHLEAAINQTPAVGFYYYSYGWALQRANRHDEAVAALRQSLELGGPKEATLNVLGTVFADMGDTDAAVKAYRSALGVNPTSGRARYGIALLKTFGPGDGDVTEMEAALRKDISNEDRAGLHFALGRAYDNAEDYEQAFDHFSEGNQIKRRLMPFDRSTEEKNTATIIRHFTADVFRRFRDCGDPSELPVFIVGMPRSGTTLVEQIAASHPDVHGAGEINVLWRTISGLGGYLPQGAQLPQSVADVRPEGWRRVAENLVAQLLELAPPGVARVTDKLPFNYTLLGIIRLMLPNARIISCVRNPLDTCLSCYTTSFGGDRGFTNDLTDLGATYRTWHRLMNHWNEVLPGGFLTVNYEELVANTERESRRLIDYLGLEWDDRCLAFYESSRVVSTASYAQVRKPIYATSVKRWKNYDKHLRPLKEALGDLIKSV